MWSLLLVRSIHFGEVQVPLIFLNIVFLGFTCSKAWMTNPPSPSLVSNWLFAMCSKEPVGMTAE